MTAGKYDGVRFEHGQGISDAANALDGQTQKARARARTQQLERVDGGRVDVELIRRRVADEERHLTDRRGRQTQRAA